MKTLSISILAVLLAATTACGHKKKPLGDKKAACDNIYKSYMSHQDHKVWDDTCMASPDETVRCVNLIMDEGKDDDCMKATRSPERTKLVTVLNGKPEAPAEAPPAGSAAPTEAPPAAGSGSAAGSAM